MLDSEYPVGYLFFRIISFCVLLLAARLVMLMRDCSLRSLLFIAVNLAGICFLCTLSVEYLVLYLVLVTCFYILARTLTFSRIWWIAVLAPIIVLIIIRYAPGSLPADLGLLGFSYMAFRLSQLVVIVRNKLTPMPGLLDYLSFSFFTPTLLVGPISSYSTFKHSFAHPDWKITIPSNCFLRIVVGAVKYLFFGNILDRLTYSGLLLDGHPHRVVDLVVAAVAYYLFLYCNFSGICDIAIGSAGLLGIKVSENFDSPFAARNMREYWNRWHITLSSYMRDMFFTPVSKALCACLPGACSSHAIALTIVMVFILIGLWHGRDANYLVWGALNSLGVAANFYYGLLLKRVLSKEQLRSYHNNPYIRCLCICATFVYVCFCLFFFANSFPVILQILQALRF